MTSSKILSFYENSNVFITGATGFLGKILIEKLLRSTSVSTLYILVRPKKGKDADSRIKCLLDDEIFEKLHIECPKFIHRIVGISGDMSLPELGISKPDKQMLIEKVDIVFHAAATVRFDENLKRAYNVNVKGAKAILDLGRQMKNLKSLMHISTAFSNCYLEEIEEKLYDHPINYEEMGTLLEKMTESEADIHTSRIIKPWPNTYTFTKALAESMIKDNCCDNLPIGIFRPSIVTSTYKEPIPGWIDNFYGPTGVCAGVSSGLLRVLHCDKNKKADLVPVDMCVAALISAAWDSAQKTGTKRNADNIPIYNYVSGENNLTWNEYCTINQLYSDVYPSNRCIWTPKLILINNPYIYMLMKFVLHFIPALIFDFVSMLFFRNLGMLTMYKKIHKFSNVLEFFCRRQWKISNDNVIKLWNKLEENDKKIFFFDMATLDWWSYYKYYIYGIRKYIMKESLDTVGRAIRKKKMFDVLHKILLVCFYFILSVLVWTSFRRFVYGSHCAGSSN